MGRKERLKGVLIACSSTLVMIIAGWVFWTRADVAAENERKSILTTTGRLAAYERLYDQAQHEWAKEMTDLHPRRQSCHFPAAATSGEYRSRLLEVQVIILDAIADEQRKE